MTSRRFVRMLRLRTQLRTLRQYEVDTLVATAAALAARRRALDDARDARAAEEARAAAAGLLAPETLHLGRRYDVVLAEDERRVAAEAARVDVALAAKRTELQEERREERKLERLLEIHRRRASEDDARATGVLLDELAILRHGRSRPGSDA